MTETGKRCLITGISRGIGKALATRLSEEGFEVLGTSRDPDNIREDQRIPGVAYLPLDLADDASIDELIREVGWVDILINNAGVSRIGPVEEIPSDQLVYLFQSNLLGSIRLTKGFLGSMRNSRSGHVINISSLAGRIPLPFSSIYAASKAGLEAFSYSLQNEVHSFGVKVTVVAPGYINTTLAKENQFAEDSPYLKHVMNVKQKRERSIEIAPNPSIVGKKVLAILRTKNPKPYYPVGSSARRLAFLSKIVPTRFIQRRIRKKFELDYPK